MKKTMTILLAALILGGEVYAHPFNDIWEAVSSRQKLNVTDQQILEALPVYIRRSSSPISPLATSEMFAFFGNAGLSQSQRILILNWIKSRADVNTHPFEVWLLGCLLYNGYAGQLNKQEAINLHRQNARLGYELSVAWLRKHGLGY